LLSLVVIGWLTWSWARRAARRSRLRWRRRLATLALVGQIVFFTVTYVRSESATTHADVVGDVLGQWAGLPPGPARTAASTFAATLVATLAAALLGWPLDRRRRA